MQGYRKLLSKIFFLGLICTACCEPIAIEISESDYWALEQMFRLLLSESEAGYILLGEKPLCTEGIMTRETELYELNSSLRLRSETLSAGMKVWEELQLPMSRFHLRRVPSEDWSHVLFYDETKVREVVQGSQELFQYILGPKCTADWVVETLRTSFDHATGKDRVLTGILMGFGVENSLYGSRLETLLEQEFIGVEFPFHAPPKDQISVLFSDEISHAEPSAAFRSINEERDWLLENLQVSDSPVTFYYLEKERQLITRYERVQSKVEKLLGRTNFLEETIGRITGKVVRFHIKPGACNKETLSQVIRSKLEEAPSEYVQGFLEGLQQGGEAAIPAPIATVVLQARKNLEQADDFFSWLDDSWHQLAPKGPAVKTELSGAGRMVHERTSHIQASIELRTLEGSLLWSGRQEFEVEQLLPGLQIGISNMREGETRSIAIPPSYGYGFTTHFQPGLGLTSSVTLEQITRSNGNPSHTVPVHDDSILDSFPCNAALLRSLGFADGNGVRSYCRTRALPHPILESTILEP